MLIKKVLENTKSGTKYVVIPKRSDLKKGDYVEIKKIEEQDDRNN
jgi:hypothetical protein